MYEFSSKYPAVISVLIVAISLAVSFLSYRKREISKFSRISLIAIRTLAFSLLLILFIEPSLLAFINSPPASYNIILIDDSRSNMLADNTGVSKLERIKSFLTSSGQPESGDKIYSFSSGLMLTPFSNIKDSLKGNGFETNLAGPLKELRTAALDDRIKSVTIVSDGNINSGDNPLQQSKLFQCPFNTVAIGDSVQKKDALIDRVNYNSKAFVKTTVKILVQLSAFRCKGENIEIKMFREGGVISTKSVPVTADEFSSDVEFDVTEQSPGIARYEASITPLKDEITNKNNYTDFLINYIDNSTKLLFISGGPGYDNSFVQNVVKRIEDYKSTCYTLKTPGSFYEGNIEGASYPDLSAIFFLDFPVSNVQNNIVTDIADMVKKFKIPLVVFAGRNTDYQKLGLFEDALPFNIMRSNSGENIANLQIVSKPENGALSGIGKDLSGLLPVYRNVSGIMQKTGTEVILMDKSSGEPIMINRNTGNFNSTAFLGYGFWKWRLDQRGSNEKALEKLITNAVSITLNKDKKQRVKLESAKDEFDYLENVVIRGSVFDENYNPTQNATLKGRLKGKISGSSREITFSASNNVYTANMGTLPPDDYTLEAEGEFNNQSMGKDLVRFFVDTTAGEFKTTKSDYQSLRLLAENTGGKFYRIDDNVKLNEILSAAGKNMKPAEEMPVKYERFNLWENRYILLAIILLLSIEWFVKKRKNIP